MINKRILVLKIFLVVIFLLMVGLVWYFLKNKPSSRLFVTEELSASFRSIDKNSLIQKNDYKVWWNNDEGYSLIATTTEGILVAKNADNNQVLEPTMIPGAVFKEELNVVKRIFSNRGFVLNGKNSSTSIDDQSFYDYVQAYKKGNYLCTATINSELSTYPGSGFGEKAKMGYQLYVSCTDRMAEAETEQIPFLDALNLKNKEQVAELIGSEGDYYHVEIHGRRAGSAAIFKKENGKYRVLLVSQEAPRCSLIDKEKIPYQVLSSIGSGDCYLDDGVNYIERSK